MFDASILTFREFMMKESAPLSAIQQAVLEFLRGRADAALFGAQAVNAYVGESRMTQDIDVVSCRAEALTGELQEFLRLRFKITLRVRQAGCARGFRLYQVRKSGNRHLVDVHSVKSLPPARRIADVLVMAPADLIAS